MDSINKRRLVISERRKELNKVFGEKRELYSSGFEYYGREIPGIKIRTDRKVLDVICKNKND